MQESRAGAINKKVRDSMSLGIPYGLLCHFSCYVYSIDDLFSRLPMVLLLLFLLRWVLPPAIPHLVNV